MNPNYTEFKFPQIKAHPWHKVFLCSCIFPHFFVCYGIPFYNLSVDQIFHKRMPPEAVDLVSRLLQYSPNLRCSAVSVLIFASIKGLKQVIWFHSAFYAVDNFTNCSLL